MTTLARMRDKVRRITAQPSPQQMDDATIDQYINDVYQYEFPNECKNINLYTNVTINLEATVDLYAWDNNKYIFMQKPAYVEGYQIDQFYDQTLFYGYWPKVNYQQQFPADGTATYTFTLTNTPIERGSISISAVDVSGIQLNVTDNGSGTFIGDVAAVPGTVNYATGVVTNLAFSNLIPATNQIYVTYLPYVAGRPRSMLFFNNQITVRPIPDKPYPLVIQAYQIPVALVNDADQPLITDWWYCISALAALRICQDQLRGDQVAEIERLYKQQKSLVLARTASQQAQQRVQTIYAAQLENMGNTFGGGWGAFG